MWVPEVDVTVKCERGVVAFYVVLCDYIIVKTWWMNSSACKLYVGRRSVVFVCCLAVERFKFKWPLYSVMVTVCMRTICVEVEQNNTKINNRTWLEGLLTVRECQNFLEEDELVVCVASVACIVSSCCPIFIIFGILQEYCRRLLVLPDTFMYTTFSWISSSSLVANNRRLLLRLRRYILKYWLNWC